MANTLGLDDEWDPIDIVIAVEKAFDIKITDEEARAVIRVGDFADLLQRKLPQSESIGKCPSAMTFYRVRRALRIVRPDGKLASTSDLSWLDRNYTKAFCEEVRLMHGIVLPGPSATWMGRLGCWLGLLIVAIAILGMVLPHASGVRGWVALGVFVSWVPAWLLNKADHGRLPKHLRSMDDLVEKTLRLNYGRLVAQGADARPKTVWRHLTQVLAEMSVLPAVEITRDTVCLRSKFDEIYDRAA